MTNQGHLCMSSGCTVHEGRKRPKRGRGGGGEGAAGAHHREVEVAEQHVVVLELVVAPSAHAPDRQDLVLPPGVRRA
eukprot:4745-Prorocentrum_minimum.AAC.1